MFQTFLSKKSKINLKGVGLFKRTKNGRSSFNINVIYECF